MPGLPGDSVNSLTTESSASYVGGCIFHNGLRAMSVTFIIVYCYRCSIVLSGIVNLLLYLIYKLNFIVRMYV